MNPLILLMTITIRDLDELMMENERRSFFSEVFLSNYNLTFKNEDFDLNLVTNETRLNERISPDYQADIIKKIKQKFPSLTLKEHATNAYQLDRIKNRIDSRLIELLNGSNVTLDSFKINNFYPEALLITPFLLERERIIILILF